jgi:hypothetical protein
MGRPPMEVSHSPPSQRLTTGPSAVFRCRGGGPFRSRFRSRLHGIKTGDVNTRPACAGRFWLSFKTHGWLRPRGSHAWFQANHRPRISQVSQPRGSCSARFSMYSRPEIGCHAPLLVTSMPNHSLSWLTTPPFRFTSPSDSSEPISTSRLVHRSRATRLMARSRQIWSFSLFATRGQGGFSDQSQPRWVVQGNNATSQGWTSGVASPVARHQDWKRNIHLSCRMSASGYHKQRVLDRDWAFYGRARERGVGVERLAAHTSRRSCTLESVRHLTCLLQTGPMTWTTWCRQIPRYINHATLIGLRFPTCEHSSAILQLARIP